MATIQQINSWFETGDIPTQEQFQQTFSSFVHKGENIEINKVAGLENELNDKLSSSHNTDENSHINLLAKLDASNLNYESTEAWRSALRVGNIPNNVAIVDERESQEVYNKSQIQNITMLVADFLADGKIRADKIEALGLTDLIEVSENSLEDFVKNTSKYNFQQNDFIAIPVNKNYSLFIFKGGDRNVSANYLPTGLANITVTMVEGLQAILNSKLDKPVENGNYFVNMSGNPTYKSINPGINSLLFWDGSDFKNSSVYRGNDGLKYGIGTTAPSEQLHLTSRARMSALVLEDVTETLPQQITYNNRKFFGTDSTGLKRQFMFADYNDFLLLANSLTDDQKNIRKTAMNGNISVGTMSVMRVSPFIIPNQNNDYYITLEGANLNVNPLTSSVSICDLNNNVLQIVPNSQVQYYTTGLNLTFYYNFVALLGEGEYKIKLDNGFSTLYVTQTVKVIKNVNYLPLGDIAWNIKKYNDINSVDQYANIQQSYYKVDSKVKPLASDGTAIFNSKINNKIFLNTDNFYIKFNISGNIGANPTTTNIAKFGLTDIQEANNIADFLQEISLRGADGFAMRLYVAGNYVNTLLNDGSATIEFVKQGTSLSIFVESSTPYSGNQVFRYSTIVTISTINPLYFGALYFNNSNNGAFGSVTILEMYKF